MHSVVGVFTSRADADRAVERLQSIGIPRDRVSYLTPDTSPKEISRVPTTAGEQPGMGPAVGGLVGGGLGTAGGVHLGTLAASMLLPGVGPIVAAGLIAGALGGIGGAIGGAKVGKAIEGNVAEGIPRDEMFIYEDALRQGRTVVIAGAEDESQENAARIAMAELGAESLDAARQQWWVGLRSAEREHYMATGGNFDQEEINFRRGFEAALHWDLRGHSWESARNTLEQRYGKTAKEPAFRRGFDRGYEHHRALMEKAQEDEAA